MTLASYVLNHDLLSLPGWKKLKAIATRLHREQRDLGDFSNDVIASKQAKGPGFQNWLSKYLAIKEAYDLDKRNGNTNWQNSTHE
jgi:hypothetical protein